MHSLIESYLDSIIIGIVAVLLVLIIMLVVLLVNLSTMKQRYQKMMLGSENESLENNMINIQTQLYSLKKDQESVKKENENILDALKCLKSHVGMIRYNAFGDQNGSNLSFSLAIIDEQMDGVVLTGIHSREQTFIYGKQVHAGKSEHTLSPEEIEAISIASKK